ncbi:MAG TPA: long-chain fatty acid--CoA ligase [Blastocatellia bacterium]|nr:long-chain fatty acid--CoA ligase [Blastocatellia bacterium]
MGIAKQSLQSDSAYASKPWLKHYDFWVPASTTYPRQPVFRALDIGAGNYPDRPYTIFFGAEMTFRETRDRALRLANALAQMGISKGDRVGIMLPNCPQFPIAFFAIVRAGATCVSMNPTYTPREFERLAKDSGIRALIVMDQLAPAMIAAMATTDITQVIVTGVQDYMPEPVAAHYAKENAERIPKLGELQQAAPDNVTISDFSKVIEESPARHFRVDIDAERDLAALQYTGGTTGVPKGAMLTHYNLFANTVQSVLWRSHFSTPEGERMLLIIPMFHVYGMTVGMLLSAIQGGTMILIPKFDINLMLDAINRHRPTFFPGVPTLYVSMLNHPKAAETDFSSIKYFNSGSAPLPLDVTQRFEELTGCVLRQGYGLSETSPTTHSTSQLGKRKPESCGIPFPDTECKIVDIETGETEVAVGEMGELCVRGPQVMKGYWNQEEETRRALREDADGRGPWFYTGDIATMDEDGYFYIVQRKKDMILVSGFNVYPSEVEEVLYSHPAVLEAGVIGVADDYRGERVKAFVALRAGTTASPEELIEYCREGLAKYKVPSEIEILPSLPKTVVGKILHRSLREMESNK